jgi:hypothetical protein
MYRKLVCAICFSLAAMAASVEADVLNGFSDITVVSDAIVSLRYSGTEYVVANDDLMLGTTTRWYIPAATGVATLWKDGDPTPAATTTAGSPPKPEDPGSEGDNFLFRSNGQNDMSSIDAINFQETIFPALTKTIFVFERGGNDTGTFEAILPDGTLGPAVAFTTAAKGGPFADTKVSVAGQNAFGTVFTTDVPVKGVRINAPGFDALSVSALAASATINVNPGEDLAAANALAQAGDTVQIAAGTYYLKSHLVIKDGVTYKGAGPGLTILDGNNVTQAFVAWGDRGATNGQVDANGVGVRNATGPKDWVLEGMTIQNCVTDTKDRQDILSAARDLLTNYKGTPYTLAAAQTENGAITDNPGWFDLLSNGADDSLTDVELQAYLAANAVGSAGHLVVNDDQAGDGGALTIENQAAGAIQNCEFRNNHTLAEGAADDGGAINITGVSVVTIDQCRFEGNYDRDDGGAVNVNTLSAVTLSNCQFLGNHTGDDGGALNINGLSVVTLNDCRFDDNYAASPDSVLVEGLDGDGGHIALQGGSASALTPGTTLLAHRCVFLNGDASDDGGAIRTGAVGSIVRLDACWFEGNTTQDNGSVLAIGNEGSGELTVTNCLFARNVTKAAGPDRMCEVTRNSKFVNCTFVGNNQDDEDLIYNNANATDTDADGVDDEMADTTKVVNCIFVNNVVGTGDDIMGSRDANFTVAATNCLFFGNKLQNGNAADNTQRPELEVGSVNADPLLDAVTYAPQAGSPAIDAGVDPATVGVTLTADYDGKPRPQGAAYDIGACESGPAN